MVNALIEQQLSHDAQASDQALAQEIALQTSIKLSDAENSLVALDKIMLSNQTPLAIENVFHSYQAARSDVDQVYWLDPLGGLRISCSHVVCENWSTTEQEFSPPDVIQHARKTSGPVFEVGVAVEPTEASFNAGVIIAKSVFTADRQLVGIVAASLSLVDLSEPLSAVVQAQRQLGRHLIISIIDDRGELIATPEHQHILWTVLNELPGADQALHGHATSQVGPGSDGQNWLFSAVPVPTVGWAVVVQRPTNEALAVVTQLHLWLLVAALLFAIGGLLFCSCCLCGSSDLCIHLPSSIKRCPLQSNPSQ